MSFSTLLIHRFYPGMGYECSECPECHHISSFAYPPNSLALPTCPTSLTLMVLCEECKGEFIVEFECTQDRKFVISPVDPPSEIYSKFETKLGSKLSLEKLLEYDGRNDEDYDKNYCFIRVRYAKILELSDEFLKHFIPEREVPNQEEILRFVESNYDLEVAEKLGLDYQWSSHHDSEFCLGIVPCPFEGFNISKIKIPGWKSLPSPVYIKTQDSNGLIRHHILNYDGY